MTHPSIYYRLQTYFQESNFFTHVCHSAILFTVGARSWLWVRGVVPLGLCGGVHPLETHTPWTHTPLGHTRPLDTHTHTPRTHPPLWSTSGRYASYWNAFVTCTYFQVWSLSYECEIAHLCLGYESENDIEVQNQASLKAKENSLKISTLSPQTPIREVLSRM